MLPQPVTNTESLAEFFHRSELNEVEFAVILQLIPSLLCQHYMAVKRLRESFWCANAELQ